MKNSKLLHVLRLLIILAIVLTGCTQSSITRSDLQPTNQSSPTPILSGTVTSSPIAETSTPPTIQPTPKPRPTTSPSISGALAEGVKTVVSVKLKQGIKWSDNTELTAWDLAGSYQIAWAQQSSVWGFLKDVVVIDDYTVEFRLNNPTPQALRQILRSSLLAPYSEYGKWMDAFGLLRRQGISVEDEQVKKVLENLYSFKPSTAVSYGPFTLSPESVTESRLSLIKNSGGLNAANIDLDEILVYYSDSSDSMPLVLSDEIDYSSLTYTAADLKEILSIPNLQVIQSPTGAGLGLWFNQRHYPLDKREVRLAFAYIIDRDENARAAMGPAGSPIEYEVGFPDSSVQTWLEQATIDQLTHYSKQWAKAEELLTSIGFQKGADGNWIDDKGNVLALEISVPADFTDWINAAENAAGQLSEFGIKTSISTYQYTDRSSIQQEGNYQILMDLAVFFTPPHPGASFSYFLAPPRNDPGAANGMVGMSFPLTHTLNGQVAYIPELLKSASSGFDLGMQKKAIAQLAILVNQELPVLGLFERVANDTINTSTRVDGWLPLDNPVYNNSPSADNYIAIQLLNGNLKRSPSGDGTFHTVWPYIKPPNFDLNMFTTSSLQQNVGPFSISMMYPPLFWYLWASDTYAPVIAESYSIIK